MTVNQLITIWSARKRLIASLFVLVVVSASVISLLLPKNYTASAAVLLDLKSVDPIAGMVLPGLNAPAYMSTQVDVVQSDRVLIKVVQQLQLQKQTVLVDSWRQATGGVPGTFDPWVAELLRKNLVVAPARESNVINIAFSGTSPEFAMAIANAVVDAYIDVSRELRTEPAKRYSAQFTVQANEARSALTLAQKRLTDYQRETGLTVTDERLDVENARLAELSTQLAVAQGSTAEAAGRSSVSSGATDRNSDVLNSPVVARLNSEVALSEAKLKELQASFGDSHPSVIQLRSNITELRSRIAAEAGKVNSSVNLSVQANRQRAAALASALETQRQRVLSLKAQRDRVSVLEKDVQAAQTTYDRIMARLDQTSLESQNGQTNVSVVKRASQPFKASSPNLIKILMMAIVSGAIFALCVAYLLELLDRRLRTEDDITELLDLPVLASVPADTSNSGSFQKMLQTASPAKAARLAISRSA